MRLDRRLCAVAKLESSEAINYDEITDAVSAVCKCHRGVFSNYTDSPRAAVASAFLYPEQTLSGVCVCVECIQSSIIWRRTLELCFELHVTCKCRR